MKKNIFLLIVLLLLTGCQKEVVEPVEEEVVNIEEPQIEEEVLTREEQTEILKNYYGLLSSKSPTQDIINLIDENVSKLDEDIVDEIVLSLEDHLVIANPSIRELSETLIKYKEYSSAEIQSYLDILYTEGGKIFSDGETSVIPLNELTTRGLETEGHLRKFPDSKTYTKVKEYFSAYIYAAIQGVGNPYIYAEDGSSIIREDVIEIYKGIIEYNPEFNMSKIFQKYLDTLASDGNDINGQNVVVFYEDLIRIIENNSKF